jgi:hypothetical protein
VLLIQQLSTAISSSAGDDINTLAANDAAATTPAVSEATSNGRGNSSSSTGVSEADIVRRGMQEEAITWSIRYNDVSLTFL